MLLIHVVSINNKLWNESRYISIVSFVLYFCFKLKHHITQTHRGVFHLHQTYHHNKWNILMRTISFLWQYLLQNLIRPKQFHECTFYLAHNYFVHAKTSLLSFRNVTSGPAGSTVEADITNGPKSNLCRPKLIKFFNDTLIQIQITPLSHAEELDWWDSGQ